MSENLNDAFQLAVREAINEMDLSDVVRNEAEKCIRETIEYMFRWGTPVRKTLEDKIEAVMIPAIEKYDFGAYVPKLDAVLSDLVEHSQLSEYRKILENFKGIMNVPVVNEVTIEDLFDLYCDYVSDEIDCTGRNIDYDDEPTYEAVEVRCSLDYPCRPAYYSNYQTTQLCFLIGADEDQEQQESLNRVVELYRWNDWPKEDKWFIRSAPLHGYTSLRRLSKFDVVLANYVQNNVTVSGDLADCLDWVVPRETPELTYQ